VLYRIQRQDRLYSNRHTSCYRIGFLFLSKPIHQQYEDGILKLVLIEDAWFVHLHDQLALLNGLKHKRYSTFRVKQLALHPLLPLVQLIFERCQNFFQVLQMQCRVECKRFS
jgi:hypothetical protein